MEGKIPLNILFAIVRRGGFSRLDAAYKATVDCGDTKGIGHIYKKIHYWGKKYAPDMYE